MATNTTLDLAKLLGAVATNLAASQTDLNQADTTNHDHGSNIVEVFKVASKAVKSSKESDVSAQLAKAADALATKTTSGSGQYYANTFGQAATQMRGQSLGPETILPLVTALLGGTQSPQQQNQPNDLLGGLLGSLMGGGSAQQAENSNPAGDLLGGLLGGNQTAPTQQPAQQQGGGDLLGSLMGGLMGGQSGGTDPNKLDAGDLINAGMAFMQAKNRGENNLQAIISAIISASPLGSSPARSQSAEIIARTLLQKVQA